MPVCKECGNAFAQGQRVTKQFCCDKCRQAFNTRRSVRGAELYDLLMSAPPGEVPASVRETLAKLTEAYRQADATLRNGRRSWQPWHVAAMRIPMVYGSEGDGR